MSHHHRNPCGSQDTSHQRIGSTSNQETQVVLKKHLKNLNKIIEVIKKGERGLNNNKLAQRLLHQR